MKKGVALLVTVFLIVTLAVVLGGATGAVGQTEVPTWPDESTLTATSVTDTSAQLDWSEATSTIGFDYYAIFRDGEQVDTVTTSTLTYLATGLSPDTTYTFSVQACDTNTETACTDDGPSVTFATLQLPTPPDTQAPEWPDDATLTASDIGQTSLTLNWPAAEDTVGVSYYQVFQDGALIDTTSATSYDVTGLSPDTEYTFRVEACDAADNCTDDGPSTTVRTLQVPGPPADDTTPPIWPEDATITVSDVTACSVTLDWPEAEDTGTGVAHYVVYLDDTQLATTTATELTVTELCPKTRHTFRVEACDEAGNCTTDGPSVTVTTAKSKCPPADDKPATTKEQIRALIDKVDGYVEEGKLSPRRGSSLTRSLKSALRHLDRGRPLFTEVYLKVFALKTKIYDMVGFLSEGKARSLANAAKAIILKL